MGPAHLFVVAQGGSDRSPGAKPKLLVQNLACWEPQQESTISTFFCDSCLWLRLSNESLCFTSIREACGLNECPLWWQQICLGDVRCLMSRMEQRNLLRLNASGLVKTWDFCDSGSDSKVKFFKEESAYLQRASIAALRPSCPAESISDEIWQS